MQDAHEVLDYLQRLECEVSPNRVLLMPQGTDAVSLQRTEEWLLPWCKSHGFAYCPRSHILWYGNRRGT